VKYCRVIIETESEGKRDLFKTQGTLTRSKEDLQVSYEHEGENVVLQIHKNRFAMQRKTLSMVFFPQKRTQACLYVGSHQGTVPVYTKRFERKRKDDGYLVVLDYDLDFPNAPQSFQLNISINFISEER